MPDGDGEWTCQTIGGVEKCVRPGSNVPPGLNGWVCSQVGGSVECVRPTNTPDGTSEWNCSYSGDSKTCVKGGPPPPPSDGGIIPNQDTGGPKLDGPPVWSDLGLPPGWTCTTNALGEIECKKAGGGVPPGGVPPGGGTFTCYWKDGVITCEGSSGTPPGGAGWTCVQNEFVGGWRCTKPVGPEDTPGGAGDWNCYSGTAAGGIICTQNPPPTQPGAECLPGQKKWCDGNGYCGWGQVDCAPDGKWKTKLDPQTGQMVLDCWELADGRRPNTLCACYFFYWNKECCEQPDCLIPLGTNGQICPVSPGQYCDFCNPTNPECTQVAAQCIVTSSNETYCGQDCTAGQACPTDSTCQKIKVETQYFWQCVPNDLSCYY